MSRRALTGGAVFAAVVAGAFFALTAGRPLTFQLPDHDADLANGELLFWAGGCSRPATPPPMPRATISWY